MMSVGYIVHVNTPGKNGGEVRSYQMAQALADAGARVHLYGGVDEGFKWHRRIAARKLARPSPAAVRQLLRDLPRDGVDIVIERHHFPAFNVGFFTQWLRWRPVIFEVHGLPIDEMFMLASQTGEENRTVIRRLARLPRGLWRRLEHLQFSYAAHVIVTSAGTREVLVQLGVPKDKISVIYNCADPALFDPSKYDGQAGVPGIALPRGRRIVLYAGSLIHEELATIVDATARLASVRSDMCLVVVGPGSTDALREQAAARGLDNDSFRALPPVPHRLMPHLLATADVVLAPYRLSSERFRRAFHYSPLKIMEALSMEKPVVTVDADELRSVFGAVPNVGFAVSGEATSWTEEIARALERSGSPELAAGRAFILAGYRWQDAARTYLDILEAVGKGGR